MSHSRVFQLEKGVRKENYDEEDINLLEEGFLERNNFPDPNWIDYWGNSESDPKDDFDWLVSCLPEGVFEVDKDNLSLTLIKRPEGYVSEFFDKIREEANKLNLSDFVESKCSTWTLEKMMRNGKNDFMVFENETSYPVYLHDWLMGLAKCGEVGSTYYMGGVLDYHF